MFTIVLSLLKTHKQELISTFNIVVVVTSVGVNGHIL